MQAAKKNPVIGIIGGRGLLGSQFRKAFEETGLRVLISGRKPDGKQVLSNKDLVKKANIVIVSVFLKDTEKVLRSIIPLLKKNQLLCDFTSVKELPLLLMQKSRSEVVGLHPMFGKVESFAGKNIFACPVRSKRWWPWLKETLKNLGLNVHEVSAKKHDELAAIHQAAQQLGALAFGQLLRKRKISPEKLFAISAPNARVQLLGLGRLLAQNLEMYTDIQLQNPAAAKAVTELAEIFVQLACLTVAGQRQNLLKSFQSASKHFGKWKAFAEAESARIFENLETPQLVAKTKRKTPSKKSIALLGPGTQTEIAAREFVARQKLKTGFADCSTISEVFRRVLSGKSKLGFVPLENLSIGPVRETMRNLFEAEGKVKIFAEFSRTISHALLGQEKNLKKVSKVFAHPQAAAQSSKFLQQKLPQAEIVEVDSASAALTAVKTTPNSLAIGPVEAAKEAGLKIIQRHVEDDKSNRTRFVAITRGSGTWNLTPRTCKKTALAFFFSHNRAGQLAAALNIFAAEKINLSRIESIPTEKKKGEFFFFTECEVTGKSPKFKKAIRELKKIASVVELGSY
ncbi:MAG: prephenate dehydratase [Patescibacteria group bacterium]